MRNIIEKIMITASFIGLAFALLINVNMFIKAEAHEKEMEELELAREVKHAEFMEAMEGYIKETVHTRQVISTYHPIERKVPYIPYDEKYESWKEEIVPVYGKTGKEDYAGFLTVESGVDDVAADYARQYLGLVPEYVMDAVIRLGWHMELTNANLAEENGFDSSRTKISGVTNFGDKIIRIQSDQDSIRNSVIHEIGHVLDYEFLGEILDKNGYKDLTNETFQNIYLHDLGSNYLYELKDELTAQLFVEYIFYPREFKAQDEGLFTIYDNLEQIIRREMAI